MNLKNFLLIMPIFLLLGSCGNPLTDWLKPSKAKGLEALSKQKPLPVQPAGIKVNYCTKDTNSTSKIKTVFIIDRSGSNHEENAATDKDRERRYGGIQKYLAENPAKENQYFSIIEFFCGGYQGAGESCRGGTPGGSGREIPDENSSPNGGHTYIPTVGTNTKFIQNMNGEFSNIVQTLKNTVDPTSSGTPYNRPLVEAYNVITEDIDEERRLWKEKYDAGETELPQPRIYYRVVMITDGVMTDVGLKTADTYIYKPVQDIVDISTNSLYSDIAKEVKLSTAFYNTPNVDPVLKNFAEDILKKMAIIGKGKFVSFINGETIDFKALLYSPTANVGTMVAQLFIYNENAIWDNIDYFLDKDSDADRVPDTYELSSYPNCVGKKDCDENGYSDGVELNYFNYICNIKPDGFCDMSFKNVDNCDLLDAKGIPLDSDKDGLNDCEETLLGSDAKNFDTRAHDISDSLSFYSGIPLVKEEGQNGKSKTSQKDIDTDFDGINNYDEIKQNFPLAIPNNFLYGLKPTTYITLPLKVKTKPRTVCFTTEVKNLPIHKPNDLVTVELLLKETTQGGKNYFKRVSKNLNNGSIEFTVEDMEIK